MALLSRSCSIEEPRSAQHTSPVLERSSSPLISIDDICPDDFGHFHFVLSAKVHSLLLLQVCEVLGCGSLRKVPGHAPSSFGLATDLLELP